MFFFLMLVAGVAGIAVATQSLTGALALWVLSVFFLFCDWKVSR